MGHQCWFRTGPSCWGWATWIKAFKHSGRARPFRGAQQAVSYREFGKERLRPAGADSRRQTQGRPSPGLGSPILDHRLSDLQCLQKPPPSPSEGGQACRTELLIAKLRLGTRRVRLPGVWRGRHSPARPGTLWHDRHGSLGIITGADQGRGRAHLLGGPRLTADLAVIEDLDRSLKNQGCLATADFSSCARHLEPFAGSASQPELEQAA